MSPVFNQMYSSRREAEGILRPTYREKIREEEGEMEQYRQRLKSYDHKPRNSCSHQKMKENRTGFSREPLRKKVHQSQKLDFRFLALKL